MEPVKRLPYVWFGGKRTIADKVWERLGCPHTYIEPFFGGGAVFFAMSYRPNITILNDKDGFIPNFLRASRSDPEAVAHHATCEYTEIDLKARHGWLIRRREWLEQSLADPDFYDAKAAGWWVWGANLHLGGGWCGDKNTGNRPQIGQPMGINTITDKVGFLHGIADKLKGCYILCGGWERSIAGRSLAWRPQTVGVFLDPPYTIEHAPKSGDKNVYKNYDDVNGGVFEWALKNGDNPNLRIAVCGMRDEYVFPPEWERIEWEHRGGLKGLNARKEAVWFSPHCLRELTLF